MVLSSTILKKVAPLAGAWIETEQIQVRPYTPPVAPLAGAWIETRARERRHAAARSRPSRARGLKHRRQTRRSERRSRAPRGRVD